MARHTWVEAETSVVDHTEVVAASVEDHTEVVAASEADHTEAAASVVVHMEVAASEADHMAVEVLMAVLVVAKYII